MGRSKIPVDLHNPGQVFACLGFLEAADLLCGPAEGGFDWRSDATFVLDAAGAENPVAAVLEYLVASSVRRVAPAGWTDPPKKIKASGATENEEAEEDSDDFDTACEFPAGSGERMALPIRLGGGNLPRFSIGHWADGSSRNTFKLYAGNRSAAKIAADMLELIRTLWKTQHTAVLEQPLDVLCPMAGSFNFDPRGGWTAIDVGYSPDKHKVRGANIQASPVIEFMAAWGLEHARPEEFDVRKVRYAVWRDMLPPMLARAALSGSLATIAMRHFRFDLSLSGKNKVVCFAQEEHARDRNQ